MASCGRRRPAARPPTAVQETTWVGDPLKWPQGLFVLFLMFPHMFETLLGLLFLTSFETFPTVLATFPGAFSDTSRD